MGTNGCLQGHWQPASQSRQAMPTGPGGCLGQPGQILAMAVKAQVTAAPVSCPAPGGPGGGSRVIVRCRAVYRIRPGPGRGIGRDPVRVPAADAGRRQARAARHLAGAPGRRLTPAAQPARSAGTPPGGDDLDAAAAHPGRRQTARAARRATASARRPGHRARGHAAHRPGERQGLPPARQHHGHRPRTGPGRSLAGAQDCPTASRLTGPERQVVPSRHRRRSRSPFSCR